ncbi:MAG: prepilin peptidase [Rhizobiaceae bacterium]
MWLAQNIVILAALGTLIYVAWVDFREFKIRNNSILLLIILYLLLTATNGFANILSEISAGLLLGVMGIVFWLLRMMGAGDAKLYFPIGLLVGWNNLGPFVLLLILFSLILYLVLKLPIPWYLQHFKMMMRVREIREGKVIPYGVPIAFAAIVVLGKRLLA